MLTIVIGGDDHRDTAQRAMKYFKADARLALKDASPPTKTSTSLLASVRDRKWFECAAKIANDRALDRGSPDLPFGMETNLSASSCQLLFDSHVRDMFYNVLKVPFDAELELVSHREEGRKQCFKFLKSVPIESLQEYYGDNVAFYFAWMKCYQTFLIVPSAIGVLLQFVNYGANMNEDNNHVMPFFGIFMAFWGMLFLKFWKRTASRWAFDFHSAGTVDAVESLRPGFRGALRANKHTGEIEMYFSAMWRTLWQAFSVVITLLMLTLAICAQICSLNLQGYMRGKHTYFEVEFFSDFADPGRVFDPDGSFGLIPVCIHATVILCLNMAYRRVATKLTQLENYSTESGFENAMICKRVCFEFVDCFAVLFYVAFYRLDVLQLRAELVALYTFDQVRRLLLESVLPYLVNRGKYAAAHKRINLEDAEEEDHNLDEYETFDDYMEMVMQFGYITLFASAFPLASALSYVGNLVEIRSDLFKLAFVTRRPRVVKCCDIGPWATVLRIFAYMSVVTNAMLFGFTSNQMRFFFPEYFSPMTGEVDPNEGQFVVATVFGLEHVILLSVLLVDVCIPEVPNSIYQRLKFRRKQLLIRRKHNNSKKTDEDDVPKQAGTPAPKATAKMAPALPKALQTNPKQTALPRGTVVGGGGGVTKKS